MDEIERERWRIANAYQAEYNRHAEAIKALDEEDKANMARCPHPRGAIEFVPNPWHSYYECNQCGKQGVRPQ